MLINLLQIIFILLYLKYDFMRMRMMMMMMMIYFLPFFQGDVGLNAAHMVMELVKDNRKIVDRIGFDYIDSIIDLLKQHKVSRLT